MISQEFGYGRSYTNSRVLKFPRKEGMTTKLTVSVQTILAAESELLVSNKFLWYVKIQLEPAQSLYVHHQLEYLKVFSSMGNCQIHWISVNYKP